MLSSLMLWFVVSRCWLCYSRSHFAYHFCLVCPVLSIVSNAGGFGNVVMTVASMVVYCRCWC